MIIYKDNVYDIGEYIETHPGGADLIRPYLGKRIDLPFEEAEHSRSARNIFKDLPYVGKLKISDS